MKLSDLKDRYTDKELRWSMGDPEIRYQAFSPFFRNLHEGKVVYYEKFMCVARLDDLKITHEGIYATAVPITPINRTERYKMPQKPWHIGMKWEWMMMNNCSLGNTQVGWWVWPEIDRVKAVEDLLLAEETEKVLKLTLFNENRD